MRPDRPCQGSARVSASKRGVSQHLPGCRPCNQPRTAAPTALPTAPLDWTTPSCTLPRAPTRKGGPTRGGSPLRLRPSPGQRCKHLGSQHNGAHRPPWTRRASRQATGITPSAHGGTIRLNNWDPRHCSGLTTKHPRLSVDPRGNPARATIERGAASAQATSAATEKTRAAPQGPLDNRVQTRTPPEPSGSDKTSPVNATAIDPPAYLTQGRAKAHSRQGNPPRTKVERQRRLPKQPRHPFRRPRPSRTRSRHAARQRGSPEGGTYQHPPRSDRVENERQRPSTLNRAIAALKAYQGTVRTTNGTGIRRDDKGIPPMSIKTPAAATIAIAPPGKAYQRQGYATASPVHSDTAHGRLHQTHKAPPPSGVPGASAAARRQTPSTLPRVRERRPTLKATDPPPTAIDTPGQRRRHRLSSKGGGQGNKSSEEVAS
ncbi:hypothetical protein WOLCODRAFT_157970 [Wolfiporia cocos MD-104 SS10]|uniref:Uncharacterized protein n=1 Tax=Wolfiporia cocos (strain MD-104) TaxID=742152 RepID=A0A2H3J6I8_WOLCO|nr:hypothetical protein WOLCODRAFT_157970 [Wolfiporia cocos MD-104 SS10]